MTNDHYIMTGSHIGHMISGHIVMTECAYDHWSYVYMTKVILNSYMTWSLSITDLPCPFLRSDDSPIGAQIISQSLLE